MVEKTNPKFGWPNNLKEGIKPLETLIKQEEEEKGQIPGDLIIQIEV